MAYGSIESGRGEVYAVPFPGPGGKWQVSTAGALSGRVWIAKGREIFYLSPEPAPMVVDVKAGAVGLEIGAPRLLFKLVQAVTGNIAPDGRRFLLAVRPEGTASPRVALVTNWPAAK